MKRITMLLCLFMLSSLAWGQSRVHHNSPEGNTLPEREERQQLIPKTSVDRAPNVRTAVPAGFTQIGFKSGTTGYGWNVWAGESGVPEGSITVNLQDGSIASLLEVNPIMGGWMAGADFIEDTWYGIAYHATNSGLQIIDVQNEEFIFIGPMGYNMTGLAYDVTTDEMYASGMINNDSYLFSVNISTGASTPIGMIAQGAIIGIAADNSGVIYGISIEDNNLYTINPLSGAGTVVGPLGFEINFAQDIGYDRNTGILYGTLYETTTEIGGLYSINTQTGTATLIGHFVAEVAGFGVPYTLATDAAPAQVNNLQVQAGDIGALEAHLSWTNPSTTFSGAALANLTSVVVERNGQVIHTFTDPAVGASLTYFDNTVPADGIYTYLVYGVNNEGQGPRKSVTLFVGNDVPAAPSNVQLVAVNEDGLVSWQAPTIGFYGGYISSADLTYTIERLPGNTVVAEDITATEYLDTAVPAIGNYYYTVKASNTQGHGGTAASDYALLASGDVLMFEPFNYPINQLPPGWVNDGTPHYWAVVDASIAGSEAPLLNLRYGPQDGLGRMISYPVAINNNEYLRLKLKQFLINYSGDTGEIIGIDYTWDDGATWNVIWEKTIGVENIHAGEYEYFLHVPQGNTHIKIAFRFDGWSNLINHWYIDDIEIEPVGENDLIVKELTGTSTPIAGSDNVYTANIQNGGNLSQNNYTVSLMKEGGVVLAQVQGLPIAFGQVLEYELTWVPAEADLGSTSVYAIVEFAQDSDPTNNQSDPLNLIVLPEGYVSVSIGEGSIPRDSQPYTFSSLYSMSQTMYYPEELNMSMGNIEGIMYSNNFDVAVSGAHIRIYMAETQDADLSQDWHDLDFFQVVFDGIIDFPAGDNDIYIPLDNPYFYNGENLVIYSLKSGDDWLYMKNFYASADTHRMRTRNSSDNNNPFQPGVPSEWSYSTLEFPNTGIYFNTQGMGGLQGSVLSDGNPVEGSLVRVLGTNASKLTGEDGTYEFPYLVAGTYDIEFSKLGYYNHIVENVVITQGQSATASGILNPIPTITVSGKVTGSDQPGIGLAEVPVKLAGYQNYTVLTDANGNFTIEEVYGDKTYTLSIIMAGYQKYVDTVDAVEVNINLENIVLMEFTYPVSEVVADETDAGALVTWEAHTMELVKLFQHQGLGEQWAAYYQQDDKVYGTIFDLTDYPDARINSMDFHHLSWGVMGPHEYLVHIVDWENFEIITTIGPLTTEVDDDWELQANLGDFSVSGYTLVGILIQPLGNNPWDAYPCITVDTNGPDGLSITAPLSNLQDYQVNEESMGDFLIELWISTGYVQDGKVRAKGFATGKPQPSINQQAIHRKMNSTPTYRVYRLAEGQEEEMEAWAQLQADINETSYLDSSWGTLTEGLWKYAVIAEYPSENLSDARLSNALLHGPTSVDDTQELQLRLYPNPVKQKLFVQAHGVIAEIKVFDVYGRMIHQATPATHEYTIDVSRLNTGFYLVQVLTLQGLTTHRVQVVR